MPNTFSTGESRVLRYTLSDFKTDDPYAFRLSQVAPKPAPSPVVQPGVDKAQRISGNQSGLPMGTLGLAANSEDENGKPVYNINYDPTYSGTIGPDTGYKGTIQTAGNVGPTAGASWTGGTSGGAVQTPWTSLANKQATRQKELDTEIGNIPKTVQRVVGYNPDGSPIYQTITNPDYAKQVAETKNRFANQDLTASNNQILENKQLAGQNAGSTMSQQSQTNNTGQTSQTPAPKTNTGYDQNAVDQLRKKGIGDFAIRNLLNNQTPEGKARVAQILGSSQNSGQVTSPTGTVLNPNGTTTAPSATPPPSPTTQTGGAQTPQTPTKSPTNGGTGAQTPPVDPVQAKNTHALSVASLALEQAKIGAPPEVVSYLTIQQAALDSLGTIPPDMSYKQFVQDNSSLGDINDAVKTILDQSQSFAKQNANSVKSQLDDNYEQIKQYNSAKEQNMNEQLLYQQHQSERQQSDANQKTLNQMTIALALRGGFGSDDGNKEITLARQRGEEALINIGKEFGFKRADVSLDLTKATNDAFNNYQMSWLQANDTLTTRLSNIDLQQLSNQQSKKTAFNDAYKEYKTSITTARKEQADKLEKAATKVADIYKDLSDNKRKDKISTKDKLGYIGTLQSGVNQNKIITQAKDVDGYYGALNAGYDEYLSLLADIESGKVKAGDVSLNPSQSAVVTSLARLLDPNSTVKNDEYERQVLGQSAPNIIKGWIQKLESGGAGLTTADVGSMKKLADGLHTSWESKLAQELQPFILNIDDWNAGYPEAQIQYDQVLSNVDRIHLPSQRLREWDSQANAVQGSTVSRSELSASSSLEDFFSVYAPSADNNNPKSYAQAVARDLGVTPSTSIGDLRSNLDGFVTAIQKHEGYYEGSRSYRNKNPGNLKYIGQAGSIGKDSGGFAIFGSLEDGRNALKNDILAKIGGSPTNNNKTYAGTYSLVPTAHAASEDDTIEIKPDNAVDYPKLPSGITFAFSQTKGDFGVPKDKILGTFRNIKTGEILRPTKKTDFDFYRQRSYGYEDLEAPRETSPAKILALGGKTLPQ